MTSYWAVRVGEGGKYADVARKHGFVAIEWHALGDLLWLPEVADDNEAQKRLLSDYQRTLGETGIKAGIGAGQVRRFAREMQDGDIVLLPHTAKGLIFVGRIHGDYTYVEQPTDGCPYCQRRNVEWLKDVRRTEASPKLLASLNPMTVTDLTHRAKYIDSLLGSGPVPPVQEDIIEHVLSRLIEMHPRDFEDFVKRYFQAIGYAADQTPYVGDGGIDVVGSLTAEGLATVLLRVQVKRTRSNVGIETVLKTRGALGVDEQGAIISLGGFTAPAQAEAVSAGKKTIILVEGTSFVEMVLEHWDDLDEQTRELVGVRPKERLPIGERFEVGG